MPLIYYHVRIVLSTIFVKYPFDSRQKGQILTLHTDLKQSPCDCWRVKSSACVSRGCHECWTTSSFFDGRDRFNLRLRSFRLLLFSSIWLDGLYHSFLLLSKTHQQTSFVKMSGSQRMMTRCSVSSLSLSGLSINSDDSNATANSAGSTITRSTLKRGFGSTACSNLKALAVQMEESSKDESMGMQVDTTGDDWGYFVDAVPPSHHTFGDVHISW